MSQKTDRYVRRGGPISQIYPGNLRGLTQALRDCVSASKFLPGTTVRLFMVTGGQSVLMRTFEHGTCTWAYQEEEAE